MRPRSLSRSRTEPWHAFARRKPGGRPKPERNRITATRGARRVLRFGVPAGGAGAATGAGLSGAGEPGAVWAGVGAGVGCGCGAGCDGTGCGGGALPAGGVAAGGAGVGLLTGGAACAPTATNGSPPSVRFWQATSWSPGVTQRRHSRDASVQTAPKPSALTSHRAGASLTTSHVTRSRRHGRGASRSAVGTAIAVSWHMSGDAHSRTTHEPPLPSAAIAQVVVQVAPAAQGSFADVGALGAEAGNMRMAITVAAAASAAGTLPRRSDLASGEPGLGFATRRRVLVRTSMGARW